MTTRSASARRSTTTAKKGAAHAKTVRPTGKTQAVPVSEVNNAPMKDMSPEAVRQRRSEAQKNATRMTRTTTALVRAKELKVVAAKEGQETSYDTLKKVWSSRGEIVTTLPGGRQVEVKRADLIRQLKALPRDSKTPFKLTPSETDSLVHILA